MSVIAGLKRFIEAECEAMFEVYHPAFEAMQRGDNPSVDLAQVGTGYVDPTIQKQWVAWSTEQQHMDAAM